MNRIPITGKLTPRHLSRLAVVYARVSTRKQVEESTGSTAEQRGQAEHARRLGFPDERIEVNDVDLGLSGTAADHRPGYQRLLRQIGNDEVGLVLVTDSSRLGRNAIEQFGFLDECKRHGTLVCVSGRVSDPADFREMLGQKVLSLASEFDNETRRDAMLKGKQRKLASGMAMSAPPAGYVRREKGVWVLDPDPSVVDAIRLVFVTYLRVRALIPTVRALKAGGHRIPRRRYGELYWVEPTVAGIASILRNENYTGDYVYGRTRVVPGGKRSANGSPECRPADPDDVHRYSGHHEAIVTREEWDEVRRVLTLNAPAKARRNLGPGKALAQRLIRCAEHDLAMSVFYHSRMQQLRSFHGYLCGGEMRGGGKQCGRVAGYHVDRAIAAAVIARLAAPGLEALRDQWREAKAQALSGERRRALEIDRARREVDVAKRRALSVDASLGRVAHELNQLWEKAVVRLEKLEAMPDSGPTILDAFSEMAWSELLELAGSVETIWNAEATSYRDRKELVDALVSQVWIDKRGSERIRMRIVWKDGEPETEVEILLPKFAHARIREWNSAGRPVDEIVDELNRIGIVTSQGNPWCVDTVRQYIRSLAKRGDAEQAAEDHNVSIATGHTK